MFGDDAEREVFFEAEISRAKQQHEEDPTNVQALIHWGGALLELAHYRSGDESAALILEAISKLKQALELDPSRAEANWCLGNAYTSKGFLSSSRAEAMQLFDQAAECFKQCSERDPTNETYKKALSMTEKAPEYYDELQQQLQMQQQMAGSSGRGAGEGTVRRPKASSSDFWWDLAGWACLAGLLVGYIALARGTAQAAPKAG